MDAEIDLDLRIEGRRLEAIEIPGSPSTRPLVLLHEGLGSVGLWRTFPRALHEATNRRVVAFSRLGHGRSDPPPAPRTPAFFHEEALTVLPAVLRQLDIEDPVLVGHSDGASIALIYAGAHPAGGLVLLAPHVVVEDVTLEAIRETRDRFETGLRERLARHHDDPDAAFRGWCDVWLDTSFRTWTLEEDAARVDCPVLLVQGADDPYGTLDQLERIEANVRGPARRLVVPGGHSPHLEAPEAVLREVVRFLDEVDGEDERTPAART
ncbi:MAG TPA: alpha/beta hydrolase [Gaiellaceae bacterium]|nr:alpha/beta hydrolase [Gaiellaceae bacterium]